MKKLFAYSIMLVAVLGISANAADKAAAAAPATKEAEYVLTIKNNKFTPQELTIPADQKVKITVKNQDPAPAEFESEDLDREKVVGANSEIVVFVGPLKAGKYEFFDDYHEDTTKGHIVVK